MDNYKKSLSLNRRPLQFLIATLLAVFVLSVLVVPVKAQVTQQPISVTQLYQNVSESVVVITDLQPQTSLLGPSYTFVEGSGFVYDFNGRMVIITNNHVIYQGTNISVTFRNGDGYSATVLGSDLYADLAVIQADAPASEYKPLQLASSSSLSVGDFVAAFGSPFGLAGSITTGIVSGLGRTITETTAGNYPIANVIQTDAPINPGNSGGPLLNANGQVVGINTATVSGSTGVGFAIPSDTIAREIDSLITTGNYTQHSYLGITSTDMTYDIAKQTGAPVTYGVLIQQVVSGGPADKAGIKGGTNQTVVDGFQIVVGGDIIIALNGIRIINGDGLSSYLEQKTLPNQTLDVTVVRNGQNQTIPVVLGTRPATTAESPTLSIPEVYPIAITIVLILSSLTILLLLKKQKLPSCLI